VSRVLSSEGRNCHRNPILQQEKET